MNYPKVEGAFTDAKIKAGGFGDVMAEQPGIIGSLGQSMKGLKGGIKAVNGAFKVLLANPIVAVIAAIVLAVTALYKAFASTKEGAEKLDQIFAGISAAMDVLRDRVLKVGSVQSLNSSQVILLERLKMLKVRYQVLVLR